MILHSCELSAEVLVRCGDSCWVGRLLSRGPVHCSGHHWCVSSLLRQSPVILVTAAVTDGEHFSHYPLVVTSTHTQNRINMCLSRNPGDKFHCPRDQVPDDLASSDHPSAEQFNMLLNLLPPQSLPQVRDLENIRWAEKSIVHHSTKWNVTLNKMHIRM